MRAPASMLILLGSIAMLFACSESGQNNPVVRGERIHQVCLACHSTSIYLPPRRKIETLPDLHKEVARWGDYYDPALSAKDVDDITAYLNNVFYKFNEN